MKDIVNKNKKKNVQTKLKLNDGTFTTSKSLISEKFNIFLWTNEQNNILFKNGTPGYDEINAWVLKIISSCVASPLVHLCNKSLEQGIFPNELKLANVLPLYKADDPFVFNSYSPVSLLCVLSKVFEKVM